jgi:hypothetical protein
MKILYLSIKNITIDSFCNLKDSFKPKQVKNFIKYYDTIYIENPLDNDCSKLLISMKNKIYYNFLNEHILLEAYLNDCNNKTILREAIIKYKCNSTQFRIDFKNDENFFQFFSRYHFQASQMPLNVIFILMGVFTFSCIFYMIQKKTKMLHSFFKTSRKSLSNSINIEEVQIKTVQIPLSFGISRDRDQSTLDSLNINLKLN